MELYNVVKLGNPIATTCIDLYDCDGIYIGVQMNTCRIFELKVIDDIYDFVIYIHLRFKYVHDH